MTQEEYRDDLIMKVSRATTIVESLSACDGFTMIVEDINKMVELLDKNWHLVPEDDKWATRLRELRTSKLSSTYITNILDTYKNDILRMSEEINKIDSNEHIVKDFDTE